MHTQICYGHIEAIETRREVYRRICITGILSSYALKLKLGDVIILGQEGGLGTGMATIYMGETIEEIIRYGNLAVLDLDMAIRKGGILNIVHTRLPKWDAPNELLARKSGKAVAVHWIYRLASLDCTTTCLCCNNAAIIIFIIVW
jgi:hypothetical protein